MESIKQRNLLIGITAIGISPLLVNGYVNSKIYTLPILYWSFEFLTWIVVPTLALIYAARKGALTFPDIGIHRKIAGRNNLPLLVVLCLLLGPIDLLLYSNLLVLSAAAFPSTGLFAYQSVMPDSVALRVLVAVYFALTAGIVEEVFFRGLLFKVATCFSRPMMVYLTWSPLLFALIHWENGAANVAATYVLGVFVALVYIAVRNLWPLIVGHVYTDYVWFF